MQAQAFAPRLIAWQALNGRHDLPWQVNDPYRVWLSEIMLQQTQVSSVLEYYPRFVARFPDVQLLAAAPQEDVLALWSGLGYYSRARNLHRAARMVVDAFGGRFPGTREALETLPGVGRSTAAAIAAFAFNARETILDGNVKRVLTRVFGVEGWPGERNVEKALWTLAESLLPEDAASMPAYTQALMDLGATCCSRVKPACTRCPFAADCVAHQQARTAELPAARPKKAQPTRYATLLLACHGGRVLLERRPPTGVWGGLMSLPELPAGELSEAWLAQLGTGEVLPAWPEFVHVFTHFKLVITPQPVEVDALAPRAAEDTRQWLTPEAAIAAGVPTPVRRLLEALSSGTLSVSHQIST